MNIINFKNLNTANQNMLVRLTVIFLMLIISKATLATALIEMSVSNTSDTTAELKMVFDDRAPEIEHFLIKTPAKLSVDLMGASSSLEKKSFTYSGGLVTSAFVLPVQGKVRVVLSLNEAVQFKVSDSSPNELILLLGNLSAAELESSVNATDNIDDLVIIDGNDSSEGVSISSSTVGFDNQNSVTSSKSNKPMIEDIDFKRTEDGAGQVIIKFNTSKVNADISKDGSDVVVVFDQVEVPISIAQKLDVIAFGTPVQTFETFETKDGSSLVIQAKGDFEQISYQIENKLVVEFIPISAIKAESARKQKDLYVGKRINMNFQKIKVYEALNILAQHNGLNLVADNIEGEISLKLDDVPWDQALDVILKIKGLDKRITRNVMLVASADKLAQADLKRIESEQQAIELQPLFTKYIKINYAKPAEILSILMNISSDQGVSDGNGLDNGAGASFVSSRGTLSIDNRTKILIVNDTADNIARIEEAIEIFDVPVKQVSIEARIVVASTSIGKEFGVQWGTDIAPIGLGGSNNLLLGGNLATTNSMRGGSYTYDAPSSLSVGLPGTEAAQSYALGFASNNFALDLELSALETAGKAEVVSQPKIVTVDGQEATIISGKQVPYRSADGSTAFKDAGLSLTVTPRITPDNSMFLELTITQDSIGDQTSDGLLIDTNMIKTQVLVKNGDTLVLGGVYRIEQIENKTQVPFFGNLPIIGNLFKKTTLIEQKNELLIFITPRLIDDGIVTQ
ncbi:MAG: type IV pilus secretin PilQ [Saccharospirillaceae bacterium]|nr:type IV pilus secretin PilQ [Pseudomonadales bacterium]NRB78278.1 type IV pilus secretin PilQ [Saccharospirillaceae bacterium]